MVICYLEGEMQTFSLKGKEMTFNRNPGGSRNPEIPAPEDTPPYISLAMGSFDTHFQGKIWISIMVETSGKTISNAPLPGGEGGYSGQFPLVGKKRGP